jgi:ribonuclease E
MPESQEHLRKYEKNNSAENGERINKPKIGDARPAPKITKDKNGAATGDGSSESNLPVGRYMACVHVRGDLVQMSILEGRKLIEHYAARQNDGVNQILGNIYLGRVNNVLPGMEAAFVDIGTPKNAVLYRGDVIEEAEDLDEEITEKKDVRIEEMLKVNQPILCQVVKNPIGVKGARLTQQVSIPGRFIVLVPGGSSVAVSKRLNDQERRRLRRSVEGLKKEGFGLIIRTAARGASRQDLKSDFDHLLTSWEQVEQKAKTANPPQLLYEEPHMVLRVLREQLTNDYRVVYVDDRKLFDQARNFVKSFNPTLGERIQYYDDKELGVFEKFHIHEQLKKATDKTVWLPSGGSLVIEQTEALTVIDVNTSKNVGSSALEDTVYQNNLEAAEEVARQLRLRDIGGIIVIDFIDMEIKKNRANVVAAFRQALSRDRNRTQVFDISELGLVEMTRKRVGEGLIAAISHKCPTCDGSGVVVDDDVFSS